MTKTFDKPLNEWVEEEVMVREVVPEVDEKNNKVHLTYKDVPHQQKTMYVQPKTSIAKCEDGQHNWLCIDRHKYLFSCTKCPYRYKAFPITFDFKDGHLIHRVTGQVI